MSLTIIKKNKTLEKAPKTKPYFFSVRIPASQLRKLNAMIYSSDCSQGHFLNGILDIFDMMLMSGQDEVLRKIFGNIFYARFFESYVENMAIIQEEHAKHKKLEKE